jgi:DNA-binding SARP family transcriptional activator/Tfp pilus assembly protein PilF
MFVLELLGRLALRRDDGLVPAEACQRRRLGLLAVLALGGRAGMSRQRVEAFFWPESTAARSRHALDQTIYAIRRALGGDVIAATGLELGVNPQLVVVDVWEFDDAVLERDWATAIGAYKGALLDGFHLGGSQELDEWIAAERARRVQQYLHAIESLADRSEEAGDLLRHVALRRNRAQADPLSAGATKKLIAVLAAAGDRAGAVKHGREYQELVRRELDIEPDVEIEQLLIELSQQSVPDRTDPENGSLVPGGFTVGTSTRPPAAVAVSLPETAGTRRSPNDRWQWRPVAWVATLAALAVGALTLTSYVREGANSPVAGHREAPLPAARAAYLHGIAAWEDRTKAGNDTAVVYFRKATAIDPGYAEAYAELAEAYVRIGYFGYRPADAMFPKAKGAALRSLQLDSTVASAHTALASELMWEHDFREAESQYSKAITLDSTNATAHQWYGVLLMILGRTREAVEQEQRASALEPLSLQIQNNYATFLNIAGNRAEARRHFHKTIAEEPDAAWVNRNPWLLQNMSRVYADDGDYITASRFIDQALAIVPRSPRLLHTRAVIYDEMGRPDLARLAFASADTSNEQYAAYRGMVSADQGSADSAFFWFAREGKWGIQPMLSLQSDRRLVRFRSDKRYADLLTRLGIRAR